MGLLAFTNAWKKFTSSESDSRYRLTVTPDIYYSRPRPVVLTDTAN